MLPRSGHLKPHALGDVVAGDMFREVARLATGGEAAAPLTPIPEWDRPGAGVDEEQNWAVPYLKLRGIRAMVIIGERLAVYRPAGRQDRLHCCRERRAQANPPVLAEDSVRPTVLEIR